MKNNRPLSMYVHIPFCVRKCLYCDFASYSGAEGLFDAYTDTLARQIADWKGKDEYTVETIFLGGGTPSYLFTHLTEKIFESIYKNYHVSENCEITSEVNPKTVSREKAAAYKSFGINRISMGMQAGQDKLLKLLGRVHNSADIVNSYEILSGAGFDNINLDVMLSLPYQTEKDIRETLSLAMELGAAHISAYSLIIEENTPFFNLYSDKADIFPDDATDRKMYRDAVGLLEENGYKRYEISNFAKKGRECRHNVTYWRCGEYKGFGSAAASYIGNVRKTTVSDIRKYMEDPEDGESEYIDERTAMGEFVFLGLRMAAGISETEFYDRFGIAFDEAFPNKTDKFEALGLLKREDERIFLTDKGIDVSNSIFCEFV